MEIHLSYFMHVKNFGILPNWKWSSRYKTSSASQSDANMVTKLISLEEDKKKKGSNSQIQFQHLFIHKIVKTELHANSYSDETLPLKINFMKSDGIRKAYVIKNYYQPKIFSIRQNACKHQPVTSDERKLKILVYQLFTTGREVLLVSISSDIAET
ncbi:hypothetical protein T09_8056 [Trichinella sp. T9]|nr:hypothetical protein T09_8056 [Trichinella sp. T9]